MTMHGVISATIVAALCAVPLLLLAVDVGRRAVGGRTRHAAPAPALAPAAAAAAPSAGRLACGACGVAAAQARWRVSRASGGPPRLACPQCGATR